MYMSGEEKRHIQGYGRVPTIKNLKNKIREKDFIHKTIRKHTKSIFKKH